MAQSTKYKVQTTQQGSLLAEDWIHSLLRVQLKFSSRMCKAIERDNWKKQAIDDAVINTRLLQYFVIVDIHFFHVSWTLLYRRICRRPDFGHPTYRKPQIAQTTKNKEQKAINMINATIELLPATLPSLK